MTSGVKDLFPTGEFQQRGYGDCQTLAGGLNTLLNAPNGKDHLASLIVDNENGTHTVNFPGRDPVIVSNKEIRDDKNLSITKDPGIMILEKASLKVHKQENRVPDPMKLFMGPDTRTFNLPLADTPENAKYTESLAGKQLIANLHSEIEAGHALIWGGVTEELDVTDIDGNPVNLPAPHAYTILPQPDGETFVIENPYDSNKPFTFNRQQMAENFNHVFIGESPGNKFNIPEPLTGVADAAEEVATGLQDVWNYEGAYSLESDGARNPDGTKKEPIIDEKGQQEALQKLIKSEEKLTQELANADQKLEKAKEEQKPDGQEQDQKPDGQEQDQKPDGQEQDQKPDGQEQDQKPDGQEQDQKPDGQEQGKGEEGPAPEPYTPDPSAENDFIDKKTQSTIAGLPDDVKNQLDKMKQELSDGHYNDGTAIAAITGQDNLKADLGLNRQNTNNLLNMTSQLAADGDLNDADKKQIADQAKAMQDQQENPDQAPTAKVDDHRAAESAQAPTTQR